MALGSDAVQAVYRGSELQHFNPKAIPGIESWWDASDASTITLDSGRVAEFADKSGNGRHAANSSSGSTQPTYVEAARNGRNVVRFASASSQVLNVPSSTAMYNFLHNGTPSYIVGVVSFIAPNSLSGWLGNGRSFGSAEGIAFFYDDRPGVGASNRAQARIKNVASIATNDALPPDEPLVIELALNAVSTTPLSLRVNGGSSVDSVNEPPAAPRTLDASSNFQIGNIGLNEIYANGDFCETMIFSNQPTESERAVIRNYLAQKWGVTLA